MPEPSFSSSVRTTFGGAAKTAAQNANTKTLIANFCILIIIYVNHCLSNTNDADHKHEHSFYTKNIEIVVAHQSQRAVRRRGRSRSADNTRRRIKKKILADDQLRYILWNGKVFASRWRLYTFAALHYVAGLRFVLRLQLWSQMLCRKRKTKSADQALIHTNKIDSITTHNYLCINYFDSITTQQHTYISIWPFGMSFYQFFAIRSDGQSKNHLWSSPYDFSIVFFVSFIFIEFISLRFLFIILVI